MGCFSDKSNLINDSLQMDNYEEYSESHRKTFDLTFYKLSWKSKPNISIFQKIDEEVLKRDEVENMEELLKISQLEGIKLVPQLYETKNILFYIYCKDGVVITRNLSKVNYFFSLNDDYMIKFCVVDISSIIMTGSEYNSIKEIKKQTRYFFDLNSKEVNFTKRNDLINQGKNEDLSDTEVDLDEEYLEELQKNRYEQHVYMSDYEKENEEEYEINGNEKEISKISIDKITNKNPNENDENEHENSNFRNLETNANENKENQKENEEENEDEDEEGDKINKIDGYEIRNNTLIITMSAMTEKLNQELKKLFYITTLKDESPYLFTTYLNQEEENKKEKEKEKPKNKLVPPPPDEEEEPAVVHNDYIKIYKKNAVPYEKRTSQHKINKIIIKDCSFSNESLEYLKDFFTMLSYYPDLLKVAIYHNDMVKDFTGWKFFRQLFRENFNIRWVSFKGASLNDQIFADIIMGMTLKRIRYLNLSKNRITNKGLYFLNKFLMKNQTLLILDLSNNGNVNSEGIKSITNALKMHPNINKLDLSNMRIKGSGHYIANFIRDNKCLKTLYLKNPNTFPAG